jgi:basic amino acid/polyamine antiporter, APA family
MSMNVTLPDPSAESIGLVRGLGRLQATAVVISTIIGTGVFLVAGPMARAAGSTSLVLITWGVGTVIALSGTLCFAELGAALPVAGGLFVYLSRGLSPIFGFLFGWTASILAAPVAMATVAAGFVRFASFLLPGINSPWLVLHGAHDEFKLTAAPPLAAAIVLALTVLNCLSVRAGGGLQLLLCSVKIGAIAAIIIAGAFFTESPAQVAAPMLATPTAGTFGAVLSALVPVMWAYNGFQNLGFLGGEIRQPDKNFSWALLSGVLVVGALYVLANATYFHVLPFSRVAHSQHVASDAVEILFGASGAAWLTVTMCISALASLHAVMMAEARVPYAMAQRGLFFALTARVQPRFRSPVGALFFLGSLSALIALTGTFEELYSLYVFAMWIFFAMAAVALVRLRAIEPELPRPYRAWGYPWTPLLFAVAALALTVNLLMERPVRSSVGLLVIMAGIPFYSIWRRGQVEGSMTMEQPSNVVGS